MQSPASGARHGYLLTYSPIMGDNGEGEAGRLLDQVLLEPLDTLEVHVVGRLVEQQHLSKQLGN